MKKKKSKSSKLKKRIATIAFLIIRPFILPLMILLLIVWFGCMIADIFYVKTDNFFEEIGFKRDLKYYTEKDYTEEEKVEFKDSVDKFAGGSHERKIIDSEWPVPGYTYISSPFGPRKAPTGGASTMHSGIDIPAPPGTEVISIMDGIVISTGWGGAGGYTITIQSSDGIYMFSYCHSDPEFFVKVGQQVKKGEVIRKSRTEKCLWNRRKSIYG